MRFIWAAYKKGCLASMGGGFADPAATDSTDEFKEVFEAEITTKYHAAWTLFAETPKGFMPVGLVLGFYSHPDPAFAPFMILGDMVWFPWASPRNKVETAVHFFKAIRHQKPMVEYARKEHVPFFEVIARHGIMRRVGQTYNVYPGEAVIIFETYVDRRAH